ncbi:hypothetical protein PCE1_002610 [Barthelona sp. PCE]
MVTAASVQEISIVEPQVGAFFVRGSNITVILNTTLDQEVYLLSNLSNYVAKFSVGSNTTVFQTDSMADPSVFEFYVCETRSHDDTCISFSAYATRYESFTITKFPRKIFLNETYEVEWTTDSYNRNVSILVIGRDGFATWELEGYNHEGKGNASHVIRCEYADEFFVSQEIDFVLFPVNTKDNSSNTTVVMDVGVDLQIENLPSVVVRGADYALRWWSSCPVGYANFTLLSEDMHTIEEAGVNIKDPTFTWTVPEKIDQGKVFLEMFTGLGNALSEKFNVNVQTISFVSPKAGTPVYRGMHIAFLLSFTGKCSMGSVYLMNSSGVTVKLQQFIDMPQTIMIPHSYPEGSYRFLYKCNDIDDAKAISESFNVKVERVMFKQPIKDSIHFSTSRIKISWATVGVLEHIDLFLNSTNGEVIEICNHCPNNNEYSFLLDIAVNPSMYCVTMLNNVNQVVFVSDVFQIKTAVFEFVTPSPGQKMSIYRNSTLHLEWRTFGTISSVEVLFDNMKYAATNTNSYDLHIPGLLPSATDQVTLRGAGALSVVSAQTAEITTLIESFDFKELPDFVHRGTDLVIEWITNGNADTVGIKAMYLESRKEIFVGKNTGKFIWHTPSLESKQMVNFHMWHYGTTDTVAISRDVTIILEEITVFPSCTTCTVSTVVNLHVEISGYAEKITYLVKSTVLHPDTNFQVVAENVDPNHVMQYHLGESKVFDKLKFMAVNSKDSMAHGSVEVDVVQPVHCEVNFENLPMQRIWPYLSLDLVINTDLVEMSLVLRTETQVLNRFIAKHGKQTIFLQYYAFPVFLQVNYGIYSHNTSHFRIERPPQIQFTKYSRIWNSGTDAEVCLSVVEPYKSRITHSCVVYYKSADSDVVDQWEMTIRCIRHRLPDLRPGFYYMEARCNDLLGESQQIRTEPTASFPFFWVFVGVFVITLVVISVFVFNRNTRRSSFAFKKLLNDEIEFGEESSSRPLLSEISVSVSNEPTLKKPRSLSRNRSFHRNSTSSVKRVDNEYVSFEDL